MRYFAFGLLTIIACLNRESGLALPALFGAWIWCYARTRRNLTLALVYAIVGVTTVAAVRLAQGSAATYWTLDKVFEANVVLYPYGALMPVLAFGAWWWYAWRCRRGKFAPLLAVAGAYMAALLVFGIWRESRLWLPLTPILALAVISAYQRR